MKVLFNSFPFELSYTKVLAYEIFSGNPGETGRIQYGTRKG